MKSIYTLYKQRLIEISGRNRSLYLKNYNKKNGYDVGKILVEGPEKAEAFLNFAWSGKSPVFKLISKETRDTILKSSDMNIKFPLDKTFANEKEKIKFETLKLNYAKRVIAQEVRHINALRREIEEIEKETGRYELFLCYPFVYGATKDYTFKAPLLLFPVEIQPIDDYNVNIAIKQGENVQLNTALLLAIANSNKLNIENIETEFARFSERFADIPAVLDYLRSFGIHISYQPRKHIFPFDRYAEPDSSLGLEIKNVCMLSRCSLANSIYNDYSILEKKRLTNNSINELLNTKPTKLAKPTKQNLYFINDIDYAQKEVVSRINDNGNMVIYGPPGTGKSQTIVNVISDCLCKNKRVLVISQKKAALEVIFNRLADLNEKAMFITDATKQKRDFYTRAFALHEKTLQNNEKIDYLAQFEQEQQSLEVEQAKLEALSQCLNAPTSFGLSLQEMYYNSQKIGQETVDFEIYESLASAPEILNLSYQELKTATDLTKQNIPQIYFSFTKNSEKNPFIKYLKPDTSLLVIDEAITKLKEVSEKNLPLFDTAKYKYSRQILAYYLDLQETNNFKPLINMITKSYKPANISRFEFKKQVKLDVANTYEKITKYIEKYSFLKQVLSTKGYNLAIDGIVNANSNIFKLLETAISNYIQARDELKVISGLTDAQKTVLNFAYKNSSSLLHFNTILSKLMNVRIYREINVYEQTQKAVLATMVDFENIRKKIAEIKHKMHKISKKMAQTNFDEGYNQLINGSIESKDYIYQLSKTQNFWPIRKIMDVYGEYLFKLFPCWLLSPENVSTLLPLNKNMFDIVLFDEASQVFIENSIPSIYRAKSVVVAGDSKQLRPTTTFMRRYMGNIEDEDLDYSTQAALEVESLLDLAVSRFNSANITYHYRSHSEELIEFSNKAFYDSKLQIAPNITKNVRSKPIERIKVDGVWDEGKNIIEAEKVVSLLNRILKNRKANETIGVITFNTEQEALIEDLIDKKCKADTEFRRLYLAEVNRRENGQDVGLFVKNLENVQGDERDIVIFSIGYAKNELGKVNFIFGTLSYDGGENRLNVAITRAKRKIYVVTSIEPEELKVDTSKSLGPKLLRSYLTYVRAVSNGNVEETRTILDGLYRPNTLEAQKRQVFGEVEKQIAKRLSSLGYSISTNLGYSNAKIALAVYDKKLDRYILGIETDQMVTQASSSALERDIFRNEFLTAKGWNLFRVWSRDWWHNPDKVIAQIVKLIEKIHKDMEKQQKNAKKFETINDFQGKNSKAQKQLNQDSIQQIDFLSQINN